MLDWGFYCRTCGASSHRTYSNPECALRDLEEIRTRIAGSPPTDRAVPAFLERHHAHDLWAECEIGVLRLTSGHRCESPPPNLPAFANGAKPLRRPSRT